MKITWGVTVYNRRHYLLKMAHSFYLIQASDDCEVNLRVYDDASTQLTEAEIRGILPQLKTYTRRSGNLGPDANMHAMFVDFLETGDDAIFIADADLIFHPEILLIFGKIFPATDGVLSLYNSIAHPGEEKSTVEGIKLLKKTSIGAAGALLCRDTVGKIIRKFARPTKEFDWKWSQYLEELGTSVLCTEKSYVQHIGTAGINQKSLTLEFGLGFVAGHETNQQYLNELHEESMIKVNRFFVRFRKIPFRKFLKHFLPA